MALLGGLPCCAHFCHVTCVDLLSQTDANATEWLEQNTTSIMYMLRKYRYDPRYSETFCLEKVKLHVDLRSWSGHVWPGQYLDLGWSCCKSFGSAAHSEHVGAVPDALAQFGQELLTHKKN